MDKKKLKELTKEKSVVVAAAGLIISLLLVMFGGDFLSIFGIMGMIGFGSYSFSVYAKLSRKKKIEEEKKQREEDERKKIEEKEREAAKKVQEENAAKEFLASLNVDEELDAIFSVLEKSEVNSINFEKGVAHLLNKFGTTISQEAFLLLMKKELFKRAFANNDCVVAKVVVEDYFQQSVIDSTSGLFDKYMKFRASRDNGYGLADFETPFIKALYGIAGRVANYQINSFASEGYPTVSPEYYMGVIEESDALKSYTDSDPFSVDEVRKAWATDIYNAPLELVNSSDLSSILKDEKNIDEGFYLTYVVICQELGEDPNKMTGIVPVASAYLEYMKKEYERIHSLEN